MSTLNRAVLIARVSTMEQADEGVSLAAQEQRLRSYAAMRDLHVVDMIVEPGVSGGTPLAERDGGKRVLDLVARGEVSHVVALKLDRLFRDTGDCLAVTRAWDEAGVALHLVDLGGQAIDTSTAMGRFFLTVIAGAAELERNLIRERTADALAHLKGRGVRLGGEALGWTRAGDHDREGRLVVEPIDEEAETVARILALKEEGESVRSIAVILAAEERRTKKGGRWHATTVQRVLARAAHPGQGTWMESVA